MQYDTLSAACVTALCRVDECTIELWVKAGHLPGAFQEFFADGNHWRVPRAHVEQFIVDRDQPSDPTALVVVLSPVRDDRQITSAEVQAQFYEISPDTLHALQHWLDLGGEPAPASDDVIFGDRLERLFTLITQPDGTPFTNEAIAERAGLTDGTYVWKLRNKRWRAQDPKLSTVAALARAFGVSPMHFFVHTDVYALLAKERQSEEV